MKHATLILAALFSFAARGEALPQPEILWTLEFHRTLPDRFVPDYRPDDPSTYYDLSNPFIEKGRSGGPFGLDYSDENLFLGENGVTAQELRGTLDVMGGAFSSAETYSNSGNAFILQNREAVEEVVDTRLTDYFTALEGFIGGEVPTAPLLEDP